MARIYMAFALAIFAATGQGQAATPDFQGIWARVSFPGFGRPLTGAGPVVRRKPGIGFAGDYTNPILKPQAAEIVKRHGDLEADTDSERAIRLFDCAHGLVLRSARNCGLDADVSRGASGLRQKAQ